MFGYSKKYDLAEGNCGAAKCIKELEISFQHSSGNLMLGNFTILIKLCGKVTDFNFTELCLYMIKEHWAGANIKKINSQEIPDNRPW